MNRALSLIILLGVALFVNDNLYSITIGLDSGHSIKELYKGGGVFDVNVKKGDDVIPTPYYSVASPRCARRAYSGQGPAWGAGGFSSTGLGVRS